MDFIFGVFFFALGAIIGSFLNVVILRHNTGRGLSGRSACFSCGRTLKYYELVPILSFVFLRGRCSSCHAKISPQYPAVEFLTALSFLAIFLSGQSLPLIFFHCLVFAVLMVILIYDLRHKIIPDSFAAVFLVLALIQGWLISGGFAGSFSWVLISGFLVALPFAILWLVSRGRWIGLGDAKLLLGFGWFFGLEAAISAVVLGFWLGAFFALCLWILSGPGALGLSRQGLSLGVKDLTMKSELPLAPFLILGFFLVFFFHFNLLSFGSF